MSLPSSPSQTPNPLLLFPWIRFVQYRARGKNSWKKKRDEGWMGWRRLEGYRPTTRGCRSRSWARRGPSVCLLVALILAIAVFLAERSEAGEIGQSSRLTATRLFRRQSSFLRFLHRCHPHQRNETKAKIGSRILAERVEGGPKSS